MKQSDMEFRKPSVEAGRLHAMERLAAFYQAIGHRACVAGGCVWFDGGAFSMMSIPSTLVADIRDEQVRGLLARFGKVAAVFPVLGEAGREVSLFVLRDRSYGLGHLQRQFRQKVLAAATRMEVRESCWEEWLERAVRCDRETLVRRGCGRSMHPLLLRSGRERIAAAGELVPGLRVDACFVGREIAAYMVSLTQGGVCEGLMAHRVHSVAGSMEQNASHLLYYDFARRAFGRGDVSSVCVGRQSIPANHPLGEFKRHAGYDEERCFLRVLIHPALAPLVGNRLAVGLLGGVRKRFSAKVAAFRNLEVLECAGEFRRE